VTAKTTLSSAEFEKNSRLEQAHMVGRQFRFSDNN